MKRIKLFIDEHLTKSHGERAHERVKEMVASETIKGCTCGCTQKFLDLRRAEQTVKKSSLIKVTCADCGKVFWSNLQKEYCFDCEKKEK